MKTSSPTTMLRRTSRSTSLIRLAAASAQALQAESAQFATTQPEIIIKTREQGGKIVGYYNLKTRGSYAIGVPEGSPVKTLAHMKGKTLGVSSLSSGGIPIIVESLADAGVVAPIENSLKPR
jgi:ABC-type nitrate/sulfonate/bicarbonate transport system substrate-binding protein